MIKSLILSTLLWDIPLTDYEQKQVECLAKNIYYEARGESVQGKIAVANVTKNRVASHRHPSNYCLVVYKPNAFSWTKDSLKVKYPLTINNKIDMMSVEESVIVAAMVFKGLISDNTYGALHYHNPEKSKQSWSMTAKSSFKIDSHEFLIDVD